MSDARRVLGRGPFRAEHLPEGSRYELSEGHPVERAPAGGRHGASNGTGVLPLLTDPKVEQGGTDVGYALGPGTVRAPDVAVGNVPDRPGWVEGAPPLALDYADGGTDDADLRLKVEQLLAAGSEQVWVERVVGPRRVEVHRPGQAMQVVVAGQQLEAPGILQNALPVEALFDRRAALEVTFRNLLQRRGYQSLDEVFEKGVEHGAERGLERGRLAATRAALRRVLARRGLRLSPEQEASIDGCEDLALLERWLDQSVTAASSEEALG